MHGRGKVRAIVRDGGRKRENAREHSNFKVPRMADFMFKWKWAGKEQSQYNSLLTRGPFKKNLCRQQRARTRILEIRLPQDPQKERSAHPASQREGGWLSKKGEGWKTNPKLQNARPLSLRLPSAAPALR